MRCIRYGNFTINHSLIPRQWNLENIIANIEYHRPFFKDIIPQSAGLMHLDSKDDFELYDINNR